MRRLAIAFVTLTALLSALSACSSSDSPSSGSNNNPQDTGTVTKAGRIAATDEVSSGPFPVTESDIFAVFVDLGGETRTSALLEAFIPQTDQCTVKPIDTFDDDKLTIFGSTATLISAGEVLTVSSPAGSLSELPNTGSPAYIAEPEPQHPLPDNLTIDIPGDAFPAYSALPIPKATQLVMASPSVTDVITADTEFTWQASGTTQTRIILRTDLTGSSSNTARFDFRCEVMDDGIFRFPDDIKAQLGTDFESINELQFYRVAKAFAQKDDTIILLEHSQEAY